MQAVISFLSDIPSIKRIDLLPFNKLGNDKIERYQLDRELLDWNSLTPDKIENLKSKLSSVGYDVRIGT